MLTLGGIVGRPADGRRGVEQEVTGEVADARSVVTGLLADAGVTVGGDEPSDIRVYDDRFFERVLRDGELGMGETYQDRWWDADAPDALLTRVIVADLAARVRTNPQALLAVATARIRNHQTVRRAARNAQAHYDVGNELYERMLDKRMIYSCAYWHDAMDLDMAQEAKLDLICRKLGLSPGMTLLDIGCGWGGLAQYAAERFGAEVTAITPSPAQHAIATRRCAGLPIDVRLADYRHIRGTFDRVVSVGMFEHVGPRNYREFFDRCDRLLAPGGLMLHHTIGGLSERAATNRWFDRYIFPGGVLPTIAQICEASRPRFVIEDVHNFGPDYDRTLMAWLDNIEGRWDEIPSYDERFRRTWRFYLCASAAGFRARSLQLYQVVFRRAMEPSPTYVSIR